MSVLPTMIYRFGVISIKIPVRFYVELEKLTLKFICKSKGPEIAKTLLKKN